MAEFLSVPLKKSTDVDIVKPLLNVLQSTYNNAAKTEEFSEAINELSRLRSNAIWKVFEKSSLDVIYSYYDQLVSLESKIPPQEVQVPFKWKDAFDKGSIFGGRMSLTISSIAYEKVCILFNMAALQSMSAAQLSLDTEEALKQATKLYQQAAGIFTFLKENVMMAVHQETTPDLHPDTLGALALLMTAQAQEVIIAKCIRDEMKDAAIAKLASQCEEFYTDILRAFQKENLKPLWDRDWLPTVAAKQAAYQGLAQFYQSLICKANKSVGEEISRLRVAVEQLKSAQSKIGIPTFFTDQLSRAQRNLADAMKDNDFIYHERIPDPKQLESIGRVAIAKPIPMQEKWSSGGKDLFAGLVPAAVQQALTAAAGRKSELVNTEVNRLREATQLLNSVLASLNLPAAIEQSDDGGLPASIVEKARAVRAAGGTEKLQALMKELPELLQRNKDILDEADRMLREEEESDNSLRHQFGPRWTRTASAKLTETFRANATKYRQIIDNAVRADNIVQQKFAQHKDGIDMLSRSDSDIAAGVPTAPASAPAPASAVAALRQLMEEVETIKAERDVIESELKSATVDMKSKFLEALARDGAIDEPSLSTELLGNTIAPLTRQAKESISRQEQLIHRIQSAHQQFVSERQGSAGGRDRVLCQLAAASDAFQELSNNLNEGVKFYNDLTQLLVTFQNKISDYCFARRTEKEELMKDLTQDASRNPGRAAPTPPEHHSEPAAQKKEAPPRPPPPSTQPPSALPYPSNPTGMPQPFQPIAGTAPYPYYQPPPMPHVYNPYATLPFPSSGYPGYPQGPPYQAYQYPPNPQYPQQQQQYPPQTGYNPYHQQ